VHRLPEDGNGAGFRNVMLHAKKLNNGQNVKKIVSVNHTQSSEPYRFDLRFVSSTERSLLFVVILVLHL